MKKTFFALLAFFISAQSHAFVIRAHVGSLSCAAAANSGGEAVLKISVSVKIVHEELSGLYGDVAINALEAYCASIISAASQARYTNYILINTTGSLISPDKHLLSNELVSKDCKK